jgi:plasmid stabilization system protein ParE
MEFTVELSDQAGKDIEKSYLHIAKDSPQNAINWRFELEEKIRSLKTFPERCGLAPEHYYSRVEIRQTFHGQYRILFTIRDQAVYVLSVRHGARKFLTRTAINRLTGL